MPGRRFTFTLGLCLPLLLAGCAPRSMDLLVFSLSQEITPSGVLVDVLQGRVDIDELPSGVQQQLLANGYKAGDLVPALCILSGKSAEFFVLSKPGSDDDEDWIAIGRYRPNIFDSMTEWTQRKQG